MNYATDQGVLNEQHNAAQAAFWAEQERQRPFILLRPPIFPDGDQWCALLGENVHEGIVGFGETPDAASRAFDEAWRNGRTPAAITLARIVTRQGGDASAAPGEALEPENAPK